MTNKTIVNLDPTTITGWSGPNITIYSCENCDPGTAYEQYWKKFATRVHISSIILLTLIIILTILGNTFVLVATWRERSLHQPNKYFIACLAVADLLVGLFSAPLRLYYSIVMSKSALFLKLHSDVCRFLVWMDTVSFTASIYTLTFISFDRFLKISKPLQYKSRMTTSRSLKIIIFIWSISFCLSTYAASPHSGSWGVLFMVGILCQDHFGMPSIKFYAILSTSTFFIPTIIIMIMYALIFVVAHKRKRMLRNGELGQINNEENQRTTFRNDLKTICMLLIVVGMFLFCWSPLFIFLGKLAPDAQILEDLSFEFLLILINLVTILPLFNSVCNPIIYACLDQTYKQAFKNLLKRMMCRPNSGGPQPPDAFELRPTRSRQQQV